MCILRHHLKMSSNVFKDSDDYILKRKRQINTLKIFNDKSKGIPAIVLPDSVICQRKVLNLLLLEPGAFLSNKCTSFTAVVQEVEPGVEYRVEFWVDARRMAIVVELGPDFPLKKPSLSVSPIVKHPWVDTLGRITGAPGLINFTVNSDLGRVVHAIAREFEVRQLSPVTSESPQGAECPPPSAPPLEIVTQESPVKKSSPMFPELADLPTSELKKLMSSDEHALQFLLENSSLKKIRDSLSELMTATEDLAKDNLRQEGVLEQARKDCESRRQQLAAQRDSFQTMCARYQALADRRSPASIRENLRAATTKTDEESEQIAQEFLSGEMTVDKFLVAYGSKRMKSHERRVKEEKLSQQLRDLLRAGY